MGDELTSTPSQMAADLAAFQKDFNPAAEAAQVESMSEGMNPLGAIEDDGVEAPDAQFWGDKSQPQSTDAEGNPEVSTPDASQTKPAETITFKANGETITLTHEEASQRLSLAEGARQAITASSKLKKEVSVKDQQIQALKPFEESWQKLEAIKHDPKQLIKLITGESYDDFMQRELEKREIYQFGTDEQKRLLETQEKLDAIERNQEADRKKREADLERVQKAEYDVEKQRIETAMQREYYKHKLPEGMDPSEQDRLKKILWNQSRQDLVEYDKQYGKITNKMVEKAFADNAALLIRTSTKAVEKQVQDMRQEERRVAKQEAQVASTRESTHSGASAPDLSKLSPRQLFDRLTGR